MPLIGSAELIEETRGGIAAFNVITIEHAEGIVMGAERVNRPVILQISENAIKYHNGQLGPIAAATHTIASEANVPAAMHLDHVTDPELWEVAPSHGFGSVMVDASKLSYEDNVAETARAVEFLNSRGLWVESELGQVGGKEGETPLSAHDRNARTDPEEAASYAYDTGVDALAVAVGSSHAMTSRDAVLDHELIAEIRTETNLPLVLHGSSGVPDDELVRAVRAGMKKINIGTALNIAYSTAIQEHFQAYPGNVDPRKPLAAARRAIAQSVEHYLSVLSV